MKDIVVIGAGKIGSTITRLLANTGDYRLTVVDRAADLKAAIDQRRALLALQIDPEFERRLYAGQPAELAGAYVYLASDDASYTSGAILPVTGGKPL